MHRLILAMLLGLFSSATLAAPKPCEELRGEIEVTIQAAGVASYTLEIVSNEEASDPNMVVGSCDNGSKKIIYQNNSTKSTQNAQSAKLMNDD